MAQNPKKTVAIVAADAEFGKTACDGARENAKKSKLDIVYDKSYPPFSTDLMPVVRAVQATGAELVFIYGYPPDNVAFVRAAAGGLGGNNIDQFRDTTHQVIVWPAEYKTGNVIYPYQDAKKQK